MDKNINEKLNLPFGIIKLSLSLLICLPWLMTLFFPDSFPFEKTRMLLLLGGLIYLLYLTLNILTFYYRRKELHLILNIVDLLILPTVIIVLFFLSITVNYEDDFSDDWFLIFTIFSLCEIFIFSLISLILNNTGMKNFTPSTLPSNKFVKLMNVFRLLLKLYLSHPIVFLMGFVISLMIWKYNILLIIFALLFVSYFVFNGISFFSSKRKKILKIVNIADIVLFGIAILGGIVAIFLIGFDMGDEPEIEWSLFACVIYLSLFVPYGLSILILNNINIRSLRKKKKIVEDLME